MMGVLNREEGISEREKVGAFIPGNRVPAKTGPWRLKPGDGHHQDQF